LSGLEGRLYPRKELYRKTLDTHFALDFGVPEMYPVIGVAISTGTEPLLEMGCDCQSG